MTSKTKQKILILLILFFAGMLRMWDVNWDQHFHLHPDERFLTMVGIAMKQPATFTDYLSPVVSTMNPANIGYPFYVYGLFPVIANKLLVLFLGFNDYNSFTILGRLLSATADVVVVLFIYKMLKLFERRYDLPKAIKYWGAVFYAVSVLPLQLAHFFAADTFLNCFLFLSCYYLLVFSFQKKTTALAVSGLFFGLALASKITALFFLPLLVLCIIPRNTWHHLSKPFATNQWKRILLLCLLFSSVCYLTIRLADPYLFQQPNLFDPSPNQLFLQNLQTLKAWGNPDSGFPPIIQWITKVPILFSLQNILFFGLGIPISALVLFGIGIVMKHYRRTHFLLMLLWCGGFFLYQSTQLSQTMRYFLLIYPFFAIFAAIGFSYLTKKWHIIGIILAAIIILLWPAAFLSIYTRVHSRVAASEFIYQMLPSGSTILSEHWDDALPLRLQNQTKQFTIKELPVFDPDTPEKWQKMNHLLTEGDYLILSSNRGWGSIPTVPKKYPQMKNFYEELFAGKLAYKRIATFTSYPSFVYLGIPITFPDDWAEEAFTVYDHPKVMIFKKN